MISKPQPAPKTPSRNEMEEDAKRKETAEEKAERELRREQATNPALMPIGDPAGAA